MIWAGVDPGLEGYSCLMATCEDAGNACRTFQFFPAPVLDDGEAHDVAGIYALVLGWKSRRVDFVVLEEQQAFPGIGPRCFSCGKPKRMQGVASTFMTGVGYGLWCAALEAAGLNYKIEKAATWKGVFGIGGGDTKTLKAKSVAKARVLFPDVDFRPLERSPKARVPDHNKCESALLAAYARRIHGTV